MEQESHHVRSKNPEIVHSILAKCYLIYTSNVSMLYPEGIKVGTITDIYISKDGLTKTGVILLLLSGLVFHDFFALKYVL